MLSRDDMEILRKIVVGVGVSVLLIAIGIWLYSTEKLGYVWLSPAAVLWIGFIIIFAVFAALAFGIFILWRSNKNQNKEDTPTMPDHIDSRTLRMIVIGAGVLVMGTFFWAGTYVYWKQASEVALPIVIIAGVTVLLVVLGLLTFVFSILKLSNREEALGLPSGSVRAVIALMLLVIFAIVAIFLYSDISSNSKLQTLSVLSSQVPEIKKHVDYVAEVDEMGKDGKPTGNKTVYYRSGSRAAEDLAKQLIVLLGTLVTAVSSFYFGSSSIAAATKPPGNTGGPNAKAVKNGNLNPGGDPQSLTITGTNLGNVVGVKLTFDKEEPILGDASTIAASDTNVTCKIKTSLNSKYGPWTVVVSDNANNDSRVPDSVTIGTKPAEPAAPTPSGMEAVGPIKAGTAATLTINGTNLVTVTNVELRSADGKPLLSVNVTKAEDKQVTCSVAPTAAGTYDVYVVDKAKNAVQVKDAKVTVTAA